MSLISLRNTSSMHLSTLENQRNIIRMSSVPLCKSPKALKTWSPVQHRQFRQSAPRLHSSDGQLTHTDSSGAASMVDVGDKIPSRRTAVAVATVSLGSTVFDLVRQNQLKKGDVLSVSRLAGIMAAKHTPLLIPLCHTVPVSHADVTLSLDGKQYAIKITARISTSLAQTGVEMEALTSASVAALTVYDMCKAVSKDIVISDIHLVSKTGGRSGDYQNTGTCKSLLTWMHMSLEL